MTTGCTGFAFLVFSPVQDLSYDPGVDSQDLALIFALIYGVIFKSLFQA